MHFSDGELLIIAITVGVIGAFLVVSGLAQLIQGVLS